MCKGRDNWETKRKMQKDSVKMGGRKVTGSSCLRAPVLTMKYLFHGRSLSAVSEQNMEEKGLESVEVFKKLSCGMSEGAVQGWGRIPTQQEGLSDPAI